MKMFWLNDDAVRQRCANYILNEAPIGWRVSVRQPDRSADQNARFHAQIGDIAKWFRINGKRLGAETLKRLLVDQFKHETRYDADLKPLWDGMHDLEMMPSLDGQRVIVLGTQTRRFPKRLASEFIEWLNAWGDAHKPDDDARRDSPHNPYRS